MNDFTQIVISIIKNIPKGKVMTYGQIARLAGNTKGARQVSRILHTLSHKYDLPWHRVINAKGLISLPGEAALIQKSLLVEEGIRVSDFKIDMEKYQYR